jgi:hydroxyacylglutathione hydrolase
MKTKIVRIPVLGGHLVNTYLLIGRRPILVDCGIPGSGDRIADGITSAGVDPSDLAMIVVTHGHVDHFGAATDLQARTGAPVAAHEADLPAYRAGHSDRGNVSRSASSGTSSPSRRRRTRPPNPCTRKSC